MKDIISRRRKELGMTQQELADKLFISDKVVSKWETGKSIPDTTILVDLSKALDISLNELLETSSSNQANLKGSSTQMLKSKFNILLIVFFTIEIISALFLIVSAMFIEENSEKVWPFILLGCAIVFELMDISYCFVRYNQLVYKYPKIVLLRKKYFNFLIWLSYPIVFAATICFIIMVFEENQTIWSLLSSALYLAIAIILTIINMKKKKSQRNG